MTTTELLGEIANLGADVALKSNDQDLTEQERFTFAAQAGALRTLYKEVRAGHAFIVALQPALMAIKTPKEFERLSAIRDKFIRSVGR